MALWNFGLAAGLVGLLAGLTDCMEWLELDRRIADVPMLLGALGVGASVWATLLHRQTEHIYISVLYIAASYIWFPILWWAGNFVSRSGVESAAINWFYAHNALGLWLTTIELAAIYYFIPKILGRPIYSYRLSLVGFWSLAFFYSLNGMHHLIGGPLPSLMIATSIVASLMMIVPVLTVAVNHHMTVSQRFSALLYSPTLSFVVLGAMAYTGVSLQGILQALVEVNRVTHFTHWTIGHAHLGVYAFVTLVLFGAIYYIAPRLVQNEWPSAHLIRWHFWLSVSGIALYVTSLSIAGVSQGLLLNTSSVPFRDSVLVTLPWLRWRSVAGLLLSSSHIIFIWHFICLLSGRGADRRLAVWYEPRPWLIEAGKIS